jgi:hypothetical protein
MAIRYKKCPNCGSTNVLEIIYGMPTHEAFLQEEAGEIKLGGCCVSMEGNDPEYYCKDCEFEWNKQQAIDYAYDQIEILIASVGGFFNGYYEVEINFKNRELKWNHSLDELNYFKTLSENAVNKLIEDLKSLKLLNWKTKYLDPHVMEGTQWSIEMVRKGRNLKKYGSNMYPDKWEQFCEIIRDVSGKEFN